MDRLVVAALLLLQGVLAGSMFDLPNYRGSIEEAMPSSEEFYKDYSSGFGKPFKMTGYAKRMPAFEKWSTDAGLIKLFRSRFRQIFRNQAFSCYTGQLDLRAIIKSDEAK